MRRNHVKFAILVLLTAAAHSWAINPAAVTGIVRNADGIAQMGAVVQVLGADSVMVGTALTDFHGRYLIANLLPGKYEVRASAALFTPAMRGNLSLKPGARAVVNLTMNAIFDATSWLPAEKRKADEPKDDWTWTLRSAANRPILRIFDENGAIVMASSSAMESRRSADRVRASVSSGDGGFGTGGVHNVLQVDRSLPDGSDVRFRGDMAALAGPFPGMPSTSLAVGYQRRLGFAGAGRMVMSYQSHPEMINSGGSTGFDVAQMVSSQKMELGDSVDLEVGGTVYVMRGGAAYGIASRPFLKVTAHPTSAWNVGYRMATSRDVQTFDGLDTIELELPVSVLRAGKMQTERGLHQELSVSRKAGRGTVSAAIYKDNLANIMLAGGGQLAAVDLGSQTVPSLGALADTATDTFRMLGKGFSAQGVNLLMTEPITPGLWIAVAYSTGSALTATDGKQPMQLATVTSELKTKQSQSATVALRGRVIHSGTQVRASYRWQPEALVTPVNPYAAFSDQAYLSFFIRQPIRLGSMLPAGLEATVDMTNLLEQGYRPVLSADGRMLFLAQSPRSLQAGLAFNF